MKTSIPHMGYCYINLGALVRHLGAELFLPPRPSQHSLAKGVRHAPEQFCIPFKANLGDLMTSLEAGAEMLVSVQGSWSCRFGYYGKLHHAILRDLGYKFDSLILDGSWESIQGAARFIRRLNGSCSTATAVTIFLRAFRMARKKGKLLELAQGHVRALRPVEVYRGKADRWFASMVQRIDTTEEFRGLDRLRREMEEEIRSFSVDKNRFCPRIMIVGEIYVVLEPLVNMDTERRLGELGALVETFVSEHRWLMHPFRLETRGKYRKHHAHRLATPYLKYNLGGEDKNTLGYTIIAAQRGFDGVVHFKPFTCMPEGMAKHILYTVSRDHGIPFISFTVDEHSAEAGIQTRLEAFVDMLEQRAERKGGVLVGAGVSAGAPPGTPAGASAGTSAETRAGIAVSAGEED